MVSRIYFALVSAMAAQPLFPRYSAALMAGDWQRAHGAVAGVADCTDRQLAAADDLRLLALADALALRDLDEEAEHYYARAQRACQGGADQLRVLSGRNMAWQALKRQRYGVARNGFLGMVRDAAVTPAQAVEGCIGLAMADHQLGRQEAAEQALEHAAKFAEETDEPLWLDIVALLRTDIAVQTGIHCSVSLADHVFWQSARMAGAYRANATVAEPSWSTQPLPTLMQRHLEYIQSLQGVSQGDRGALNKLNQHIEAMRGYGSASVLMPARLVAVLAAMVGGFTQAAENLFDTLGMRDYQQCGRHQDLDLLYVSARIASQRGQSASAMSLYTAYSLRALHCLRAEALTLRGLDPRGDAGSQTRGDDISARLPAKYRRAYRYIIENITHSALTTREVAAHIDVTERALQMVFKRALGLSPGALIRKLRLEGIRDDLLDDSRVNTSVLTTANRWGVTSRSALVKSYRKQFNESPSETING